MTLDEIMNDAHATSTEKGWHEEPHKSVGDDIALMHSELSEALEEFRNGKAPYEVWYGEGGKPEGMPIEIADAVIRIADFCKHHGIDLARAVEIKLAWNKSRPFRHGGKKL